MYSKEKKGLSSYLRNGRSEENINPSSLQFSEATRNFEEARQEIKQDLNMFFEYMKNSIYYASGVEDFFEQELHSLRRKFRDENEYKLKWHTIIFKVFNQGNITIPGLSDLQNPNLFEKIQEAYLILETLER